MFFKIKLAYKLSVTLVINLLHYLSTGRIKGNPKKVLFVLKNFSAEPYYYPIFFYYKSEGYQIYLSCSLEFIANTIGPLGEIFKWKNLRLFSSPRDAQKIFIDYENPQITGRSITKLIPFDYSKPLPDLLPFPMHPNVYKLELYKEVEKLRKAPRKMRVLFSGNILETSYSNPILRDYFQLLNRVEIINVIENNIAPDSIVIVTSKNDEEKIQEVSLNRKIVLYKWKWSLSTNENLGIKVEARKWLQFISQSDFFLCCPGVKIPHSHNLAEAMSVGTIPILQYADWLKPELQHGINCICFTDEFDLVQKLRAIMEMSKTEIESLRRAVINYYDEHMSYTNERIKEFMSNQQLFFYNEIDFNQSSNLFTNLK